MKNEGKRKNLSARQETGGQTLKCEDGGEETCFERAEREVERQTLKCDDKSAWKGKGRQSLRCEDEDYL